MVVFHNQDFSTVSDGWHVPDRLRGLPGSVEREFRLSCALTTVSISSRMIVPVMSTFWCSAAPPSYRQGADPRRRVGGARMSDPPVNRVISGDRGERVIAQRIGPVTHCLCMFERQLSLEGGVLFPC